ncbi:MAG: glycosyltransferase family 9 protein [Vulcanimicrobiota bacterium]
MKRALVVHTGGGLGDVLLSGPVVDTLAGAGYSVDFLARAGTSPAVERHPNINELLTIEGKDPQGLREMRRWASLLKARRYDLVILLWSTTRWAWTLFWSGIPVRVGQDSRVAYAFLFTHRARVRSEHGDESSHWTEILLDYPRSLGLAPVSVVPCYPVTPQEEQWAEVTLSAANFGRLNGPLIGFHSGKGLPLTPGRWPSGHFGHLARNLQEQLRARLILTGGPDEVVVVQEVASHLPEPCLNLAGKTSVPQLAALQKRMNAFVCPDSGPMHLAAAVGTPVVGIYALDEDFPARWAPFNTISRTVRPPRPACRPGCTKPTCPNFQCYLKVNPESVVNAVKEVLNEANSRLS